MTPRQRERRFNAIVMIGCVCCRDIGIYKIPEVHHQNLGGHAGQKRLGDANTVGLCKWHHRGEPSMGMTKTRMERTLGPSLAVTPKRFRARYGTDEQLLARQNELIADYEGCRVGAA